MTFGILTIFCVIFATLSAVGIWKPNRFGITMLWAMLGFMFAAKYLGL